MLHGNDKLIIALNLRIMLNLTSFTEKGNEKGVQVQITSVPTKNCFQLFLRDNDSTNNANYILKHNHVRETEWKI